MATKNKKEAEFIVGIGASAGGLEALERFFRAVQPDGKTAYIVVQHLSPDFKSLMSEILGRYTTIPIRQAEQDMLIEPDTITLNVPRTDLTLQDNRIVLKLNTSDGANAPINVLFNSLAEEKQQNGIAVVLSGTGFDGSKGALEMAKAGGLILTQNLESALFGSMPNAIKEKVSNSFDVAPEDMPEIIQIYTESPTTFWEKNSKNLQLNLIDGENALSYLLSLLQRKYDVDFSQYKPQTLIRRLDRRLSIDKVVELQDYVKMAQQDGAILEQIYRDMLLDVTHFFRDPEAFTWLGSNVVPQLVARKQPGERIRIWIAACSTGEEAYSMTILFLEEIERQGNLVDLQVFATDLHPDSIENASKGIYREAQLEHVSYHRRQKFFEQVGDKFKVKKSLRQKIVFSVHNLMGNPHFTRQDFISCRNMLIYIRSETQKEILSDFLNDLELGGILFLGPSEHLDGGVVPYFETLSRHWRIFQKSSPATRVRGENQRYNSILIPAHMQEKPAELAPVRMIQGWELNLLKTLIPAGFICDYTAKLKEVYGKGHQYLSFNIGRVDLNLPELLPEKLGLAVRNGLSRASREKQSINISGVQIEQNGQQKVIDMRVVPFHENENDEEEEKKGVEPETLYLISLEESKMAPTLPQTQGEDVDPSTFGEVQSLKLELAFTRESLQATLEELESANEELQSSNEELVAANEELQSSNEELSSVNEELYTVNSEYQDQNLSLNQLFNDTRNMMRAGEVLIVFLDEGLNIREVTPACYEMFGLIDGDVGRPISHFPSLAGADLDTMKQMAIDALQGFEGQIEVKTPSGVPLLMQVIPYIEESETVTGVILSFINLTKVRELEAENRRMFNILSNMPALVTYIGSDYRYQFVNNQFHEVATKINPDLDPIGLSPREVLADVDFDELNPYHERALAGEMVEITTIGSSASEETAIKNVFMPNVVDGVVEGIFVIGFEVTELEKARLKAEKDLFVSEDRYRSVVDIQTELITRWRTDDFVLTFTNPTYEKIYGAGVGEPLVGKSLMDLVEPEYFGLIKDHLAKLIEAKGPLSAEEVKRLADGTTIIIEWTDSPIFDSEGNVVEIQGVGRNVTNERQAQEALAISEAQFKGMVKAFDSMLVRVDPYTDTITYVNEPYAKLKGKPAEEIIGTQVLGRHNQHVHHSVKARRQALIDDPTTELAPTIGSGIDPSGQLRYIRWHSRPILDLKGKVVEIQAMGHDITEVMSTQQSLEIARNQIEAINNNLPFWICQLDHDHKTLYLNHYYEKTFGVDIENALNKNIKEVIGEEAYEQHKHYYDQALAGERMEYIATPSFNGENIVAQVSLIPNVRNSYVDSIFVVGQDITQKFHDDAKIKTLNTQLRTINDGLPVWIANIDREHRFTYLNRHYQRTFGIDVEGCLGKSVAEVLGEGVYERGRKHYDKALAGETVTYENIATIKNVAGEDEVKSTLVTLSPLEIDGEIGQITLLGIDLSEQHQIQLELANANNQLKVLTDNLPIWIANIDREHRFTYLNRYYEETFGIDVDGAIGKTVAEVLGEEVAMRGNEHLNKALSGEIITFLNYVPRNTPEGEVAKLAQITLIPQEIDGEIQTISHLAVDVSEQLEAKAKLEEANLQLNALNDHFPMWVAVVDKEHRYQYVNRYHERLIRETALESVVGQPVKDILGERAYSSFKGLYDRALAGETISYIEEMSSKGEEKQQIFVQMVPDKSDEPIEKIFVLVLNISELSKAQKMDELN